MNVLTDTDKEVLDLTSTLQSLATWLNTADIAGVDDAFITAVDEAIILLKVHAADSDLS